MLLRLKMFFFRKLKVVSDGDLFLLNTRHTYLSSPSLVSLHLVKERCHPLELYSRKKKQFWYFFSSTKATITSGVHPLKLKISKITPIVKSEDETDASNSRPISLVKFK